MLQITVLKRVEEDDFLLLASDGLWDVMSNAVSRAAQKLPATVNLLGAGMHGFTWLPAQEAISLAMRCMQRAWERGGSRKAAVRVAATVLTRAAVDRGSKDNVTVVIIDLKRCKPDAGTAEEAAANPTNPCEAPTSFCSCGTLERQDTMGLSSLADLNISGVGLSPSKVCCRMHVQAAGASSMGLTCCVCRLRWLSK
jgi:hypothetical protein